MSLKTWITLLTALGTTSVLLVFTTYLSFALFGGATALYEEHPAAFLLLMFSMLLLVSFVHIMMATYVRRITTLKERIQELKGDTPISFTDIGKDEIGEIMQEVEELSKDLFREREQVRVKEHEKVLLAKTDVLTRLPNRDYYLSILENQSRHEGALVVSILLNDLTKLRAFRGHEFANDVLLHITAQLLDCGLSGAIIGRTGSNHFMLYTTLREGNEHEATTIASHIQSCVQIPLRHTGKRYSPILHIGFAYRKADENIPTLDLVTAADLAVTEKIGRIQNGLYLAHSSLNTEQTYKYEMELALEKSIQERDFQICYQPIVDLEKQQLSLEVLTRWEYQGDWISPVVFIPILEDSDMIDSLTRQIAEKVIEDFSYWKDALPNLSYISINVSPLAMKGEENTSFIVYLTELVLRNELQPNQFCLEVTESALLEEETIAFIERAKSVGFLVAIDDFGTGYASMSSLAQYPFDILKMDRSFVIQLETNQRKHEVAQAIIDMAKRLDIRVVAEGVETHEQLTILHQMGTHAIQGYLFSEPRFLTDWNTSQLTNRVKTLVTYP